jgi:hypothetical protein
VKKDHGKGGIFSVLGVGAHLKKRRKRKKKICRASHAETTTEEEGEALQYF